MSVGCVDPFSPSRAIVHHAMTSFSNTNTWPREFAEVVVADSEKLGWQSIQAFACEYAASEHPLRLPSDPEFLTLEINTSHSAKVTYRLGNNEVLKILWNPGDVIIYPNFDRSRWSWETYHGTSVFFIPYSRLKQVIMQGNATHFRHPAMTPCIVTEDATLRSLLQLISTELVSPNPNGEEYISSVVDAALIHLAKNYVTECDNIQEDTYFLTSLQLEKIRKYVSDNVDTTLSVAELADVAGVKPFEFPRAFRSTVGITPYQYIIRERVDWAEYLLRSTDLSLAEISYTAGFSSQSHFTRTFRKQKGATPQGYRQTLVLRP